MLGGEIEISCDQVQPVYVSAIGHDAVGGFIRTPPQGHACGGAGLKVRPARQVQRVRHCAEEEQRFEGGENEGSYPSGC